MNMTKLAVLTVVALTLTACASSGDKKPTAQSSTKTPSATKPVETNVQFDAFQEVAYQCEGGKKRLLAMYGVKNNVVAGVQVVYADIQSPLMLRTTNPKYNEFSTSGRHVTWTQNLAAPAQVAMVNAQGLSRLVVGKDAQGKEQLGVGIVVQNCVVDKALTAKLPTMADDAKIKWLNRQ